MKVIQDSIFGKPMCHILLGLLLIMNSCDYGMHCNLCSGCFYDAYGDSVGWNLKFKTFNDAWMFKFQSKGKNHLIMQGGTYRVDTTHVFEVYEDSLKVSYMDTLDVGVLNVKTLAGKAYINNTDTVSVSVTPFFVGHRPKLNKSVYLKMYPCGYLKYGGKNLITDTIVFRYIRPVPDFKNAFREIFKKKKK